MTTNYTSYILIENPGHMIPEDLYLMGTSPKRGNDSLIGNYCTGNKYGLAGCFRWDAIPYIFAGSKKIELTSNMIEYRGEVAEVIFVDGRETSITSNMGIDDWKPWMVIREFISNAIDAASQYAGTVDAYKVDVVHNPVLEGREGVTRMFIPMTNDFSEVLMHFDTFFAFKRKPDFINEVASVYFKHEESPITVYRKGIRCFDDHRNSSFDINFNSIDIKENRLTDSWELRKAYKRFIQAGVTVPVLSALLKSEAVRVDWLPERMPADLKPLFRDMYNMGERFTCPAVAKLGGMLMVGDKATMVVPNIWFKTLCEEGLAISPFDKQVEGTGLDNFIRLEDHKHTGQVKYYLESVGIYGLVIKTGNWDGYNDTDVVDGYAYIKHNHSGTATKIAAELLKCIPTRLLAEALAEEYGY